MTEIRLRLSLSKLLKGWQEKVPKNTGKVIRYGTKKLKFVTNLKFSYKGL